MWAKRLLDTCSRTRGNRRQSTISLVFIVTRVIYVLHRVCQVAMLNAETWTTTMFTATQFPTKLRPCYMFRKRDDWWGEWLNEIYRLQENNWNALCNKKLTCRVLTAKIHRRNAWKDFMHIFFGSFPRILTHFSAFQRTWKNPLKQMKKIL